ncbi:DUF1304 domain-containing protein [Robiginitalea sediminis]|uniref:DUF1304 domain-containing protein n=1 Tax=Robiginitalea sediminis TaxID=1982593 RepID=UPI000B4A5E8B|nr:DUF1304 domain-containing protein [Robiginitalea sediminis]
MRLMAQVLIGIIALEHLYFLWLEMFAWTSRGPRVFSMLPKTLFEPTRKLAANQGLYNGFLAGGLLWSLLIEDPLWSSNVAAFFLCCVALAGIYGGWSAHRKIFFVQGLPALVALLLLYLALHP